MIAPDAIHLWTWDARPYPAFPALIDVWADAPNWETGHWLTGRLGAAPLDALVSTILADSGMTDVDAGDLGEGPAGYVVDRPMAPRAMLDPLALAFAFDAAEQDGVLRFNLRDGEPVVDFGEDDLILPDDAASGRRATCRAKSRSASPISATTIRPRRRRRAAWSAARPEVRMPTSRW